ncbi:hypothetical protein OJ997_16480 [Solirubrobacter phytolaccae]|uniref:Uncharacterized protein n=1 Tax=Solirubrobacter phytolaccae TaxID=1404360 RepID=A0A9X3ND75_9ACTN|nr:hypothetical protein [Solirubrobacter phytolaccae]MDA0181901.1 hypothetical protein [Solirubrobacter phytolaccae]
MTRRPVWMWASALLAVAVVALLVWALSVRSDLDDTQAELDQANAQVATLEAEEEPDTTMQAALDAAYEELSTRLGTKGEDLEAAMAAVEAAKRTADAAVEKANTAKEAAAGLDGATEQAQATADQARAEAEAAKAKGAVVTDCAKASFAALGELLDGGSLTAQLSTLRDTLEGIADDCKTAFAES